MSRKKEYVNYDTMDYDYEDETSYEDEKYGEDDDLYNDYVDYPEEDDDEDRELTDDEINEAEEILESGEKAMEKDPNYSNSPLFEFINRTAHLPLLTREEEATLADKVQNGTPEERQEAITILVERNLRLVVHVAKRYNFPKVDMDDLIQEGVIGLMKAAEKFDHTRKYKFGTYATYWIRQAITRKGSEQSRNIRLPAHMITKKNLVNKTGGVLKQEGITDPTYEDIAERSNLTISQVRAVMEKTKDSFSLEDSTDDDNETTILDYVDFGQMTSVEDLIEKEYMSQVLNFLFQDLSPREKTILTMRNGLFGEKEMNVRELSEVYGISRERIRQICKEAVKKMEKKAGEMSNSY